MPFTLDRALLNRFSDLAVDAIVAVSRLVDYSNGEQPPDMVTAVRAITHVFSLVARGRVSPERGLELIQQIGMRFVDRKPPIDEN